MEQLIIISIVIFTCFAGLIWFLIREERKVNNILTKDNDKLSDDINHQKYLNDQLFSRIELLRQDIIELQKSPDSPDKLEAYNLLDNVLDQIDIKIMDGDYYISEINPEFNDLIIEANDLLFTAYKLIKN